MVRLRSPLVLSKVEGLTTCENRLPHRQTGLKLSRSDFLGVQESITITHCENRSKLSRSDFLVKERVKWMKYI